METALVTGLRPIVNMGCSTAVSFPAAGPHAEGPARKHSREMGTSLEFKSVNYVLQDLLQASRHSAPLRVCLLPAACICTAGEHMAHITLKNEAIIKYSK